MTLIIDSVSFPQSFSGNPRLQDGGQAEMGISGCPIKTFGHDKIIKK
jgi:hypothetical protein